jgi:hypothetical protein
MQKKRNKNKVGVKWDEWWCLSHLKQKVFEIYINTKFKKNKTQIIAINFKKNTKLFFHTFFAVICWDVYLFIFFEIYCLKYFFTIRLNKDLFF